MVRSFRKANQFVSEYGKRGFMSRVLKGFWDDVKIKTLDGDISATIQDMGLTLNAAQMRMQQHTCVPRLRVAARRRTTTTTLLLLRSSSSARAVAPPLRVVVVVVVVVVLLFWFLFFSSSSSGAGSDGVCVRSSVTSPILAGRRGCAPHP